MQPENIKVFVRSRPLESGEKEIIDIDEESQKVIILEKTNSKAYQFDRVFSFETKQQVVYDAVVRPLIKDVMAGYNCTVFAYGQTGTGKTYTMEGERSDENSDWEDDPHLGIIPRAISHLFDELRKYDHKWSIKVSFLELYNEDTYDLLSPLHDTTKLKIFEDANKKGSVIVGGLEEIMIQSKQEIYEILKRGSAKRQTAATLLNACSSRSHSVFTITVNMKERSFEGLEITKVSKLNLVDLAGSENIARSGAQDKRAREAGNINQSLLTLGRVIMAIVEKRPHIPYRESKLTRLLQDSLGGRSKTSMIATISPDLDDIENTIGTLEYASQARIIINRKESNLEIQKTDIFDRHYLELRQLEANIRNEVASEFRREVEKIKLLYQVSTEEMVKKDEEIDTLTIQNADLQTKLSSAQRVIEDLKKEINKVTCEFKREFEEMKLINQVSTNEIEKIDNITNENDEFQSKLRSMVSVIKNIVIEIHEVSSEVKKEYEKMKLSYEKLTEDMVKKDEEIHNLQSKLKSTESIFEDLSTQINNKNKSIEELTDLRRQLRETEQLAQYRKDLVDQLTSDLKLSKAENLVLKEEIKVLNENNKQQDMLPPAKKATRVRKKNDILEESNDYANMTFDGGDDEIIQVSAKKVKKTVPVKRRRAINEAITLSGKKKKLNNPKDIITEVSPISAGPTTRSTRSRNTRRKLDFE